PLDGTENFGVNPYGPFDGTVSSQPRRRRPPAPRLRFGFPLPAAAGEPISRATIFSMALVASTAFMEAGLIPPPIANIVRNTNTSLYVVISITFALIWFDSSMPLMD